MREPLAKVALPFAPKAAFRVPRKVEGTNAVGAPPSTVMVPPVKSMSTRVCMIPVESTTATVVLPVNPETLVLMSMPVLRPASVFGGGTALEALCARLISSAARVTYSPSWVEMEGISVLRRSSSPLTVPPVGDNARALPLAMVTISWPAEDPLVA